jgi:hypothetical protein
MTIPTFWEFLMRPIMERITSLEDRIDLMSTALDDLIAQEASLEAVVAQVVADNTALHQELATAIANSDTAALQTLKNKLADQTTKLSALLPPPAPTPAPAPAPAPVTAAIEGSAATGTVTPAPTPAA